MTKTNKTPATTFTVTDRVSVTLPDTPVLHGFIEQASASGWFAVRLDPASIEAIATDLRVKDGRISARARSLTLAPAAAPAPVSRETDEQDDEQDGDEAEAETTSSKMADALRKARPRYTSYTRPLGGKSLDCGDKIAQTLRDLEPEEVCDLADKVLQLPTGYHLAKYAGLNPGQKRMNSGNKIRSCFKKAIVADDHDEIARLELVFGWTDGSDDEGETEE
jgi:hypothetical protein